MRFFIQIAHGPDAGSLAHRGLLIARAAAEKGHEVDVFLAGGATGLLAQEELELATAFGPRVGELVAAILARGGRIYASSAAIADRGVVLPADIASRVEPSPPDTIIDLAVAADRVLTYG